MQLVSGTSGICSNYSNILKDITNRDRAPLASPSHKFDHEVAGQDVVEPPESENTPDNDQRELDSALELKESGSYKEASDLFKLLAAKNNRRAQFELGEMYFHGHFVEQNYRRAGRWYVAAANVHGANDSYKEAFNRIGYLYENGLGITRDHRIAAKCYRKAAIAGNDDACCNLAYLYEHGFGVRENNAAALFWYSKAGIHFGKNSASTLAYAT